MELEAVIDKVTLDMGYESLKAKQKEAIMLFFYKRKTYLLYYQQDLEKVCLLHHNVVIRLPGTNRCIACNQTLSHGMGLARETNTKPLLIKHHRACLKCQRDYF